jgi:hypothetical protein
MNGGENIWDKKFVAYLKYFSGSPEEDNEKSASVTGLPSEILTRHFPNKKQVR